MSTNSRISVKVNDVKKSIYCHWDGYPSNQLPILRENYNTLEKAQELIALGDISVLEPNIKPSTTSHSFKSPEKGVVIAYHRDRGEEYRQTNDYQQYNYYFDNETLEWKIDESDN